jgi:excisionase family DNA binding protein
MNQDLQTLLSGATIDVEQAAQLLGLSKLSVYSAIRKGEIRAISVGKRLKVLCGPLRRKLELEPV